MSSCEKCWSDSRGSLFSSPAERYDAMLAERREHPCSPEEQAGPDAQLCPGCKRKTLHQYTGEPMCGCKERYV